MNNSSDTFTPIFAHNVTVGDRLSMVCGFVTESVQDGQGQRITLSTGLVIHRPVLSRVMVRFGSL